MRRTTRWLGRLAPHTCWTVDDIVARGHDRELVHRIEHLLYIAEYKRRQSAPGVKITRKQFGRQIGSFQALQHRMVDLCIEIEQARSAVLLAIRTLEADRHTRELNVSAAKNLIGRVNRLVAEETIQLHGGMAMTWEYALGHYAKRLVMIDHQLGDTDYHLQRYIDLTAAPA